MQGWRGSEGKSSRGAYRTAGVGEVGEVGEVVEVGEAVPGAVAGGGAWECSQGAGRRPEEVVECRGRGSEKSYSRRTADLGNRTL